MTERTKAIVLNKIKYGDNSIIVNLFSLKYGRVSIIIKSCRSKRSPIKANMFFPLNIVEIDLNYKHNRNMQHLKCANSVYILNEISTNIYKVCLTQFMAEIVQKSVKEETPNTEVYDFLEKTVLALEKTSNPIGNFHIVFMIGLAKIIGFAICNNYCKVTPYFNIREGMFLPLLTTKAESLDCDESAYLSQIIDYNPENFSELKLPYKTRLVILEYLVKYYKYHILNNQEIYSMQVLNSVFEH